MKNVREYVSINNWSSDILFFVECKMLYTAYQIEDKFVIIFLQKNTTFLLFGARTYNYLEAFCFLLNYCFRYF